MKITKTKGKKVLTSTNASMTSLLVEIENNILVIRGFATSGTSAIIMTTRSDDMSDYVKLNYLISRLHPESIIEHDADTKRVTIYNANTYFQVEDLEDLMLFINEDGLKSFLF